MRSFEGFPCRWRHRIVQIALLLSLAPVLAFAQTPPAVGRPILFVHGICADAASWGILRSNLILDVQAAQPALYPVSANQNLYYDVPRSMALPATRLNFSLDRFFPCVGGDADVKTHPRLYWIGLASLDY